VQVADVRMQTLGDAQGGHDAVLTGSHSTHRLKRALVRSAAEIRGVARAKLGNVPGILTSMVESEGGRQQVEQRNPNMKEMDDGFRQLC